MEFITKDDCYLFGNGTHYKIYEKLGAHPAKVKNRKGTYFAVWAPNAVTVSVVGEFNDWIGFDHNMERIGDSGIWELFIPGVKSGDMYKYVIVTDVNFINRHRLFIMIFLSLFFAPLIVLPLKSLKVINS